APSNWMLVTVSKLEKETVLFGPAASAAAISNRSVPGPPPSPGTVTGKIAAPAFATVSMAANVKIKRRSKYPAGRSEDGFISVCGLVDFGFTTGCDRNGTNR